MTRKSLSPAEIGEHETGLGLSIVLGNEGIFVIAKLPSIMNRFSATATARLLQKRERSS